MKIAIARPEQAGEGWTPFPTDPFMHPHEIRVALAEMLDREDNPREMDPEHHIVTMNRTVLDQVGMAGSKQNPRIVYDDVFLWNGESLVPLLYTHDEEWLVHFSLGDLFNRCRLEPWRFTS